MVLETITFFVRNGSTKSSGFYPICRGRLGVRYLVAQAHIMNLTNFGGALSGCLFLTFLLSVFTVSGESGGTNSWIKPSSGNWDDPSAWSLGVLPNSSQSVLIANPGWKA